jgi:adenosine deaminase/aminodeoxyfutalosine deaminase
MGNCDHPVAEPSAFIRSLPKAELHLHLEGTIGPETLVELARCHGESLDLAQAQAVFHYTDFTGFMLCFRAITQHVQTPEDYELITYRMMQHLREQNVRHAEVFVGVGTAIYWRRKFEEIFDGLERGRKRGERDFGVSVYWIADAVRHFGPEAAQQVVNVAAKLVDRNMVGFGLGGDERRGAPELFPEVYASAKNHGLRLTCHAGETTGPEAIWGALRLGSERIGHGLSASQDSALIAHLAERQIPVEICVTSNLRTGCCASLEKHPVRKLFDAGALITLNSDDPGPFETTLNREYQIAQDAFDFTDAELTKMAVNSFQASFLPEDKKQQFINQVSDRGATI